MPRRLEIVFDDELHLYKITGEHVPSVTQILDETVPKQLSYFGYRCGLDAALHLIETTSWPALQMMDRVEMEEAIRKAEAADVTLQLSPNRVRDSASDVGTDVHLAIDHYLRTGELPEFDEAAPEQRGFIRAFSKFVFDQDPEAEEHELIVANGDHRYAGKLDFIGTFGERGRGLIDFKTSRRVKKLKRGTEPVFEAYRNWKAQVRLYREAYYWTEAFHGNQPQPIDFEAICILHELGDYVLLPVTNTDWALDLPAHWHALHAAGEVKAPWEKDPAKRAAGLKRSKATPAR
jgi:hypothetical protein